LAEHVKQAQIPIEPTRERSGPPAETLALGGTALLLATDLAPSSSIVANVANPGRISFALALPVFGGQHFYYASVVAALAPAWIPDTSSGRGSRAAPTSPPA